MYSPRFHRDSLTLLPPPSAALPDLDGLVDAAADGERRGAVEVDGGGEVVVGVQPLLTTPVCDIPDPEALVVGDGEEVLAARVEGQAAHPVVVAEERRQAQPGR